MDKLKVEPILTRLENDPTEHGCKGGCPGLVFKCIKNAFLAQDGRLIESTTFRIAKRRSCKCLGSCPTCAFWFDIFNEESSEWKHEGIPCLGEPIHEQYYKPVGHSSWSYEYGSEFDSWELQLINEKPEDK